MYFTPPKIVGIFVISLALYSSAAPLLDRPRAQGIYGFHYVTEFRHVGRNPQLLPRVPNMPHRVPVRYVYHAREDSGFADRSRLRPAASNDDVLRRRGLKIFADLLETSGLSSVLRGPDYVTLFVPTDEAFSRLPKDMYQRLLSDANFQRQVLQYHITRGRIFAPQIGERRKLVSLFRDEPLTFEHMTNGQIRINGAEVVTSDLEANHNVIHVINYVLFPPSSTSGFSDPMNDALLRPGVGDETRPTVRVTLEDLTTLRSSTTTPI